MELIGGYVLKKVSRERKRAMKVGNGEVEAGG